MAVFLLLTPTAVWGQFSGDYQTNTISGVVSNWPGDYFVGSNYIYDVLLIQSAGQLSSTNAYIGYSSGAHHNLALVSDWGSIWTNIADVCVGYSGWANRLIVTNGGRVLDTRGYVGYNSSASNNTVLITGLDSVWTNKGDLCVGFFGSGNLLTIENGGRAFNNNGYVGASANNNTVLVTDSGSVWSNTFYLYIGNLGAGNSLIVTNGGRVFNTYGYVGYNSSASNNTVLVTGLDSAWRNTSDLYLGYNGASNQLLVADGATVANSAGVLGYSSSAARNVATVTGSGSVWTNQGGLAVGQSGSSNRLIIAAGGKVFNTVGYIGSNTTANANEVLVSGAGSVWTNTSWVSVGYYGSSNRLTIADGGRVASSTGYLGYQAAARQNAVLVTGTNSTWILKNTFYMGFYGSSNQLVISDGGRVAGTDATVGVNPGASNNVVLVTGAGSIWTNSSSITVGLQNWGNQLVVSNGAQVFSYSGYVGNYTAATNNSVTVTGNGSLWYNSYQVRVGDYGSSNRLTVSEGGRVVNVSDGYAGTYGAARNNSVVVTDAGSVWSNTARLFFGYQGSANSLIVSNGGQVINSLGYLGYATTATNNLITVIGTGSVWNNTSNLWIGFDGTSNQLLVADGAQVFSTHGYVGSGSSAARNIATITGSGSIWTNRGWLSVGQSGSSNRLIIADGGRVFNTDGCIGSNTTANANEVLVTGSGSVWTNASSLHVGYYGSVNQLTITNGGQVFNSFGYVGYNSGASNNEVTVDGAGSVWNNGGDLYIGYNGARSTLDISSEGTVLASNLYVGFYGSSSNNLLAVSGGNLIVTNSTANGTLEVRRGTLTFNGGTIVADNFIATNGASSVLQFNAGTLSTRSTTIANGQPFTVGNGTDEAVLQLRGGTHQFADDLIISTAAKIIGTGTIVGDLTQYGALSPGESPGVIHIDGDWTQAASAVLLMEIAGRTQGTEYDFLDVTGSALLNGTLQLEFLNGFVPTASDQFTLITSGGGISGMFTNITGGRIWVGGNYGSFAVSLVGNNFLLSDYRPAEVVPEPSTLWLWCVGTLLLWRYGDRPLRRRGSHSRWT